MTFLMTNFILQNAFSHVATTILSGGTSVEKLLP